MKKQTRVPSGVLSNAEVAQRLASVAQLLAAQGANQFKVGAYRRAAATIKSLGESIDELVRRDADLTVYPGIGRALASAIAEIVQSGTLKKLEHLRAAVSPEVAALSEHPRLDAKRVLHVYQQLGISSVAALKENLASGEVGRKLGTRVEQHLRQALAETNKRLLYDVHDIVKNAEKFLRQDCGVRRVEVTGEYRRRREVIGEISFLIDTDDFARVVGQLAGYGGRAEPISASAGRATFRLSSGVLLTVETAPAAKWGVALIAATGAEDHLEKLSAAGRDLAKLARVNGRYPSETAAYRKLGLRYIEPELREGNDEVALAAAGKLPTLVEQPDVRGELHAHTTSSDGAHTMAQMAAAARARGYAYLGITDHSQSLKIAGGVSEPDLKKQIRAIDRLNEKLRGIRVLKSAEVDIHPDGSLDYPDSLLRELDYTVCSIHSRFGLGKKEQTERILRAMDNPHFTILGHATGRRLLRRPGYEIDLERIIAHARDRGCFFEINSSPERLDLSAAHARLARQSGVKIAICTDAHSVHELDFLACGIDVARRAGLKRGDVLNCLSWPELRRVFAR